MRKIDFNQTSRRMVLILCFMLGLLVLAGCSIPEDGFSWKLWGFETHSFTVGDEEINMRLDTSGFGRYEVELTDDTMFILRDGETILEGFFPIDRYADLEQEILADGNCAVIEHLEESPPSLLCRNLEGDGYTFLAQVDGSSSAVLFFLSGDVAEDEVLDRVHRLQFTKQN